MSQSTRTRTTTSQGGAPPDEPLEPQGGGNLADQARRWSEVARRARERCREGAEAEAELMRRRNRSGQ